MSERIKELLIHLTDYDSHIWLNDNECKELVDYITNIEDYKSRIDKAVSIIEKQKVKMYKSRNKIAMFILMKLEKVLKGVGKE